MKEYRGKVEKEPLNYCIIIHEDEVDLLMLALRKWSEQLLYDGADEKEIKPYEDLITAFANLPSFHGAC